MLNKDFPYYILKPVKNLFNIFYAIIIYIMNMNIFKMNKVKQFWMCVLLVIFLGYIYFYIYREKEGFDVPGVETANSLKRELRITAEGFNDKYGLKNINRALTKLQKHS